MKCKSIKILLSLSLLLLLIPIFPVLAMEDEDLLKIVPITQKHYETSEYGAIMKRLSDYYARSARSINTYSDELLETLQERKEYHNYIYELKELPESELVDMTFDDNQINAIKNFDGSDEMATRASATISVT